MFHTRRLPTCDLLETNTFVLCKRHYLTWRYREQHKYISRVLTTIRSFDCIQYEFSILFMYWAHSNADSKCFSLQTLNWISQDYKITICIDTPRNLESFRESTKWKKKRRNTGGNYLASILNRYPVIIIIIIYCLNWFTLVFYDQVFWYLIINWS